MQQHMNGQDIRRLRTEWDMSQQEFATKLPGVSVVAYLTLKKNNLTPGTVYRAGHCFKLIQEREGHCPK